MVGDYGRVQSWQTTCTPTGPSTLPQQDAVRESLRVALFSKWRDSARRDANCGQACPYAAKRTATARKAAILSAHRPAVLTGTAISPACYRQMARRKPAEDPCVEQLRVCTIPDDQAHWAHITWKFEGAHRSSACAELLSEPQCVSLLCLCDCCIASCARTAHGMCLISLFAGTVQLVRSTLSSSLFCSCACMPAV